jgi:pseudouridine-5'-phosphate glycosidase
MLVVQPPPQEYSLPPAELDALLQQAIAECAAAGVAGAATTPWLLARLAELSDGRTLAVNRALLAANARLAGMIAHALTEG